MRWKRKRSWTDRRAMDNAQRRQQRIHVYSRDCSLFLFFPLSGVRCCLQLFHRLICYSPPHLLFFSTLLCLLSSSSSLPALLSSSHLSLHSPPISVLASLVSSCPALITLPLSSVVGHRPSFLRVQPTVICS